jgi:hypothetical protein
MKTEIALIVACFLAAGCSNENTKIEPSSRQVAQEQRPSLPTPTPTPAAPASPKETPAGEPVKTKSVFDLYSMPGEEAGTARSASKIIAISIKPTKVTSFTAILPSVLVARCKDSEVGSSKVELLVDKGTDGPKYQPSVVIPSSAICDGEIKVTLEVFGLEVELGDALIADVVSESKAAARQ